jgi:hypothetical protein
MITAVKTMFSWILYMVGDIISKLLQYNCLSFLYPVYNRVMVISSELDTTNKIWTVPKD